MKGVYLQQRPFNNSLPGSSPFALLPEASEEVNQPKADVFILTCLPVLFLNLFVNSVAALVIHKKEKTRLNRLILYDCVANMASMLLLVLYNSPWFVGWPPFFCLAFRHTCKHT